MCGGELYLFLSRTGCNRTRHHLKSTDLSHLNISYTLRADRMKTPALLSAALLLLLLLLPEAPATSSHHVPISVLVKNSVDDNYPSQTYRTYVQFRGILLGGLKRLQDSNKDFNFTYTENPNYGPFLESVNGLAGNFNERTYWELLVKTSNDTTFRPNVGIGCYIPTENDQIILNYNKY